MESMTAVEVSIAVRIPAVSAHPAPLSRYLRSTKPTGMMTTASRI
jgi:hypothetical protein